MPIVCARRYPPGAIRLTDTVIKKGRPVERHKRGHHADTDGHLRRTKLSDLAD